MDLIDRQVAIDTILSLTNCSTVRELYEYIQEHQLTNFWTGGINDAIDAVIGVPSAQPERDIPIKPKETTDRAWGIPHKQAVCPKCDYYLGHIAFLGDYKGKRVTYCETCGQAIDWEGWDENEQDD